MQVLVIGGGGREHTLVWKLAQSKKVTKLYAAPGNPGMKDLAECVDLDIADLDGLADWAEKHAIDLTVVGPEAPLVAGIVDVFKARGLTIFGPSAKAAEIEGSKIFSKELMEKYGVPTAFFKVCDNLADARAFVEEKGAPIVIKADGLAAGKGVVVAMTRDEALAALDEMMGAHKFGSAGNRVVIEEFMEDHKRVNDGDQGPNTGGMGAYCPAPVMTDALKEKTVKEVLRPIVDALAKEGRPYSGCLYAGLMIKGDSVKVVEFNARFGDPETQVVLPLLKSDLAEIMVACANGTLTPDLVEWSDKAAVCVVMASGGYPASYKKGIPITGLKAANAMDDVVVFHAGTREEDGKILTNGGRVLGVTAVADDIPSAQQKAYDAVDKIHFDGAHYRQDIAWRALRRLKAK